MNSIGTTLLKFISIVFVVSFPFATSPIYVLKDIVEIIEKVITIVAIVVGGIWTYWTFIKNRQKYPRAEVINLVHKLATSGEYNILRVNLSVRNIGNVLIQISEVEIVVSQIEPIPETVESQIRKSENSLPDGKTEYSWDRIDGISKDYDYRKNEIEPGESQSYQFDFRIHTSVKKIEVYTSVRNISKRSKNLVWDCATIVDTN